MLRDSEEHPRVLRRREAVVELAGERGVPVTELVAQSGGPLVRLASLVGAMDFASVYLAILFGIDPTPVEPINALKSRIRE
jgi:glucose/mannose-6-phosphate isomerase